MESSAIAVGLFNEAKLRNHQSGDWERDLTWQQQRAEISGAHQAIKAALVSIVQFFRRPATALKGAMPSGT